MHEREVASLAGRFITYAALSLLVQPLAACSDPAPAPQVVEAANAVDAGQAEAEGGKLVLAFGDSLYAGYGVDQKQGFAAGLQRALGQAGIAARVHDAGVSGDTSAAGRQRLAFALDGLDRAPDLVIVGLGGNDMLRGLDPADTRANLDAILTELGKRGIDAVLTGMVAAPNMGRDYAASFNAIYPELAAKFDVPLYPFFLDGVIGRSDLMLPDGIHPNEKGIEAIVGKVAPLVEKRLADQG
jgi:acyl-CoA thioesterase-1